MYRQNPNQGEASARQLALEQSRGEFLCGVDADDWFYPDAIQRMVSALLLDPEVFTVSLPLMVLGDDNRVLGVSSGANGRKNRVDELQAIRFPIPSSMVRTKDAQGISYDLRLSRGCDTDFQTRYLLGRCYRVLDEPGYAYYGESGLSTSNILKGLHYTRLAHWKWRKVFPVQVARLLIMSLAKTLYYRFSRLLYGGDRLHARFSRATRVQFEQLELARRIIAEVGLGPRISDLNEQT